MIRCKKVSVNLFSDGWRTFFPIIVRLCKVNFSLLRWSLILKRCIQENRQNNLTNQLIKLTLICLVSSSLEKTLTQFFSTYRRSPFSFTVDSHFVTSGLFSYIRNRIFLILPQRTMEERDPIFYSKKCGFLKRKEWVDVWRRVNDTFDL